MNQSEEQKEKPHCFKWDHFQCDFVDQNLYLSFMVIIKCQNASFVVVGKGMINQFLVKKN